MIPVFRGSVHEGRLHLGDREAFDKWTATLEGKPVVVSVKQHRATRSNPANAYFHGVLLPMIADASEHTPAEVKDALKVKFLTTYAPDGFPIVKRTRDLDTKQFAEFVDQCRLFALDYYGVDIPEPNAAVQPEYAYEDAE